MLPVPEQRDFECLLQAGTSTISQLWESVNTGEATMEGKRIHPVTTLSR
jgi:hypothetical protein